MNYFKSLLGYLSKRSVIWKTKIISSYFSSSENILDFGCGDLSLAKSLKQKIPTLKITGVDVTNFSEKTKDIKFVVYDGKILPFKDNSFDTVIAFYVFHHCEDVLGSLNECIRVAKRRILLVESVYRSPIELPFMSFMDFIYNIVKPEIIPLNYNFFSYKKWLTMFEESKMKVNSKKIKQVFLPSFMPIGISYVFEAIKKT